MKLNLKNKKIIGPTVIVVFIVWMLFFDSNSYLYQLEYNREINKLEKTIDFYKSEIKKNRKTIEEHAVQENINNYAREKYHYKKDDEFLYLIEYDTID
ncbi:septum formation initiator [Wenyingzhuangia fucanilytica]|uniref:Septum formation initiator n=1 Tax=Wenyingzhuangia fucanilytica TaxID=1790137 RepID=A0A1B1Y4R3_9FLAO|nr:septum formation initiator [Wenyingzhuangia fucanilytica]ANW95740.1 septum formation initiator [Wenyingzhuangia fucanilytica]